jgi:hypothetical protein
LASTPPNEAFLREVDEQLRLDQALSVWTRYGRWIVAAVLAALVSFGGWLWWSNHQKEQAGVAGEELTAVLNDLTGGRADPADPRLAKLATSKSDGVAAAALMTQAGLLQQKGDAKGAAAAFAKIVANADLGQAYRDLALVRQTAIEFDTMSPDAVIARLKPLAAPGNPWFGSAGEMVGIAYMKQGKTDLAGATFAALAKDETVPESIRSRVVQLASSMGVEAAPVIRKGVN